MPSNPIYFGAWFYNHFMSPLIEILKSTLVLDAPLYDWLFGLSILSLIVRVIRRMFFADDKKE